MLKKNIPYFTLLFMLLISFSCSESSGLKEELAGSFDRQLLLENVTDNIILPAFEDFTEKLAALDESVASFVDTQNAVNLEEVQMRWVEAYKIWQHIEMFKISKAEEIYFIEKMNTYPASISKIEYNIDTSEFDLESNNNWVAQGFPTLDYLLFGIEDNNTSTLLFYQNTENIAYLNYFQAVVSQMVSITEIVSQDWIVSRDNFVSSSENSATSSLNLLTNDFIFYFEKGLRTNKFGIPAGVFSANNVRVANVEAYYNSTISKTLSLEALKAVHKFFKGQSYNTTGTGESLQSYLNYMTETSTLSNLVLTKFNEAERLITELDENFEEQINTNNDSMVSVFKKLQEGVVLLKTDMLSVLSISVDYIDADGD
jgi:hypothetical protein